LQGGVFANDVRVYDDLDVVTIDFLRLDPRDARRGIVVARITAPQSCILKLEEDLAHRLR